MGKSRNERTLLQLARTALPLRKHIGEQPEIRLADALKAHGRRLPRSPAGIIRSSAKNGGDLLPLP
ncbi:hypothetical protein D3C71_1112350 [compost metagenome]